jgi:hypothetical protein
MLISFHPPVHAKRLFISLVSRKHTRCSLIQLAGACHGFPCEIEGVTLFLWTLPWLHDHRWSLTVMAFCIFPRALLSLSSQRFFTECTRRFLFWRLFSLFQISQGSNPSRQSAATMRTWRSTGGCIGFGLRVSFFRTCPKGFKLVSYMHCANRHAPPRPTNENGPDAFN